MEPILTYFCNNYSFYQKYVTYLILWGVSKIPKAPISFFKPCVNIEGKRIASPLFF